MICISESVPLWVDNRRRHSSVRSQSLLYWTSGIPRAWQLPPYHGQRARLPLVCSTNVHTWNIFFLFTLTYSASKSHARIAVVTKSGFGGFCFHDNVGKHKVIKARNVLETSLLTSTKTNIVATANCTISRVWLQKSIRLRSVVRRSCLVVGNIAPLVSTALPNVARDNFHCAKTPADMAYCSQSKNFDFSW